MSVEKPTTHHSTFLPKTVPLLECPEDVNPSQWQAIINEGDRLLIVAGPGTGKTHTLTYRVIRTAQRRRKDERVLAITFTNKAAEEMKERLTGRVGNFEDRITVGTFHHFCLLVLRRYTPKAGLPADFSVVGPEEIDQIATELWPGKKRRERKSLVDQISRWKSTGFHEEPFEEVIVYNKKLRERSLLDFDDLLLETLLLLQAKIEILAEIQAAYPAIFVDEYQDINAVQHALLRIIVGKEGKMTAIGDPHQAIYGFRGADVGFFNTFSEDFPGAKVLSLSENYRSSQNLLAASGQMIAKQAHAHVPELVAKIYTQGKLTIHGAATDKAEAEYVVHQIEKMVGGTSMFSRDSGRVSSEAEGERSFGDVAILYRLNSQCVALQKAFERSGIPYHVCGPKSDDPMDQICPPVSEDVHIEAEKVSLMTMHAAKGLEFPVVFIVGCEQKILPLDLENLVSDREEERRLLYVGMTRAKEQLFLVHAKRRFLYGQTYRNAPSEFLSDIEEDLKEYERATLPNKPRRKSDEQMKLF